MKSIINDVNLLNIIKNHNFIDDDARAGWIGGGIPFTDIDKFQNICKWAHEHLIMYRCFNSVVVTEKYDILDFGCGLGSATNHLSVLYPNSTIDGIEISDKCLEFCNTYNKKENITYNKTITNKLYDIIYFLETFEHITYPNNFDMLDTLISHLKPTGILRFTVPVGRNEESAGHHRGMLNNHHMKEFENRFGDRIVECKYISNTNLFENPIIDGTLADYNTVPASHFMITFRRTNEPI